MNDKFLDSLKELLKFQGLKLKKDSSGPEKGIITYKISRSRELLLKCTGEDRQLLTTLLIELKSIYKMKLKIKPGFNNVSHRYIYVIF